MLSTDNSERAESMDAFYLEISNHTVVFENNYT